MLTNLKIDENPDNEAFDVEFFDFESDNRKLDDDVEDYEEDVIVDVAQFSMLNYNHSIQTLKCELAEIERVERESNTYEGRIAFYVKESKIEELGRVMEDYEYFQVGDV